MKKIGLVAVLFIAFTSCTGGANDTKQGTDTTTFPSEQKPTSDAKSIGENNDTTERTPGVYGATPGSPRSSRSTTPGNQSGDSVLQ